MTGGARPDRRLRVLTTREEIRPGRLAGATAVVIDVFMASTTLLTILENGARRVFPVGDLDEAERVHRTLDSNAVLRGGEQGALPVDGWDCGPFPEEYPPERVRGRDVIYVSTNGTAAIAGAAGASASRILIAGIRNAPAVSRYLEAEAPGAVYLVCAGSMGRLALEDMAGAMCILNGMDTERWRLNDAAWLALDLGRRYEGRLDEFLRNARGGRWFFEHARREAFQFASEVGASDLVAEVSGGELVPAPAAQGAVKGP